MRYVVALYSLKAQKNVLNFVFTDEVDNIVTPSLNFKWEDVKIYV